MIKPSPTQHVWLHSIIENSTVNGPGRRTVIHFQGCTIGCAGCFNTQTWKHGIGKSTKVDDLVDQLMASDSDITISGGEPLEQSTALFALLFGLKNRGSEKTVILFSGMDPEVLSANGILGFLHLAGVDLVIAGPYDKNKGTTNDLRGSFNQEFLFLSDRISNEDVCKREVEVMVGPDGSLNMSGFPTQKLVHALRREGTRTQEPGES